MQVTKPNRSNRPCLSMLLSGLIGAMLLPMVCSAAIQITAGAGSSTENLNASWNLEKYPTGIPYVLLTNATGNGTQDIEAGKEFDAIRGAFSAWQSVPTARISYQSLGETQTHQPGKVDGINVVGFDTSQGLLSRAGLAAVSFVTVQLGTAGRKAGELAEADILFFDSDQVIWKVNGRNSIPKALGAPIQLNLEEIATREVGHFNGLNNSFLRAPFKAPLFTVQNEILIRDNRFGPFTSTALMYPYALDGSPLQNVSNPDNFLTSDERIGISALYPTQEFKAESGGITGQISVRDLIRGTTDELCGAHVLAVRPGSLAPVASALSGPDGRYRIEGLEPGLYLIYVEPSSPADLRNLYSALDDSITDVKPEFFNNAYFNSISKASVVSVAAGLATHQIDVELVRNIPNREITYASGGIVDPQGNPVVLKIEPDDTLDIATRLRDENHDGQLYVSDIIDVTDDKDVYLFQANRDDVYKVEVFAERNGSALDPVIRLFGPGIQAVPFATADNTPGLGKDARLTFTAPEKNNYYVEVSSATSGGNTDHYYLLVITKLSGRVPVTPLGGPQAVLSVPIADASLEAVGFTNPTYGHIEITELKVQFLDVDGDAGLNPDGRDFLPPSREPNARFGAFEGGFGLFNDNGPSRGLLDYDPVSPDPRQDMPITMKQTPTITPFGFGFEVTFVPQEPLIIPAERMGVEDATPDFHIVIQPSLLLHHGDDFQVVIPRNGMKVRNNNSGVLQEATLFSAAYPAPAYRNKYTGDIVEFLPFTPVSGGTIDAFSNDFPVIGLNLIGDPSEQYWVSQVEMHVVGYSYHNLRNYGRWSFFDYFQVIDPLIRRLDLTDFRSLTNGVYSSGGFNLYSDNDNLGAIGDGVPNFGLNGDFLLPLAGNQRYEVVPLDQISDDNLLALLPKPFQAHLSVETFLDNRDNLNLFAFKVILPVQPHPERLVPPTEDFASGTLGADMFITLRTSNSVDALDVFFPFIDIDGVRVSNNLSEVIRFQDPGMSTLVNGRSLRAIDNGTNPAVNIIEVRPQPMIQVKDLVNPADSTSRGNVIGTVDQGSPPLAVLGLNLHDYNASAMVTHNVVGTADFPTGNAILNTGVVLNALTLSLDPVDTPARLPTNFILPVLSQSIPDPDLVPIPRRGVDIILDDDTTSGNTLDDDLDGARKIFSATSAITAELADEELLNGQDDDLDGLTDENDMGDEDAPGLNGQYDTNDDTIPYLQHNSHVRYSSSMPFTEFNVAPVVTSMADGSLRIAFPDLTTHVLDERGTAFDLVADPLSIFIDAVFFRVDHTVLTVAPGVPTMDVGALTAPPIFLQNGWVIDFGDNLVALFENGYVAANYFYLTEVPNNDTIIPLRGNDVFFTARMGAGANVGDSFRMRLPANGLRYSYYRGANVANQDIRPASTPVGDLSSGRIRVGSDNVPPSLSYIKPVGGNNRARAVNRDGRIEYEFEVQFTFNDPDNDAAVDFYWDTDRFGLDGQPIPLVAGESTINIIDNDGRRPYTFTFQFPEELARRPIGEAYIYGVVTDDVNPSRAIFAPAPIILDATSRLQARGVTEFLIADNMGQIFGTGGANINIPEYRQTRNIIRDIELTPSERGALFLNGYGDVVLRGDPGVWSQFVRTSESVTFPEGGSIALGGDYGRDIEPDWLGNRYFLLDCFGGLYNVGKPSTFPLTGIVPLAMNDIYRDMELTPTSGGLMVLRGDGAVFAVGDAPRYTNTPSFGTDLARDLAIAPLGGYILNAYGHIFPLGQAPVVDTSTQVITYPGSDVYRAIEVIPGGGGLLVMDREGQVFPIGDILLGPNPVPPGVVPPPGTLNPGDPIVFPLPPPAPAGNTVVTGERTGAFIDLEFAQSGQIPRQTQDNVWFSLEGLCHAISREDLSGMLNLLTDDFLDKQGHDRNDFAAVWRAFFDHYRVLACNINDSSMTITRSNVEANTYIISTSLTIMTLDPVLQVMAPSDNPLDLEAAETLFTVGPVEMDQVAHFFETDDGRGWRMSIIDDDYTEGVIDRADPILDERHFTRTRARSKREGEGYIFLNEEDQLSKGSSQNSTYILRFTEEVEGHAPGGGPIGGWHAPVLYFLWFTPVSDSEGGQIPVSTFRIPVEFNVRIDPTTQIGAISGGERAVFGMFPTLVNPLGTVAQNSNINQIVDSPLGWRFFNQLGITVDAGRTFVYDSHVTASGGAESQITLNVPDVNSSAYLVNLSDASDALAIPRGTLPLEPDLDLRDAQGKIIIPDFAYFQKSITVQPDDYVLVTFRADEQGGVTDRLFYAVMHIIAINEPQTNNTFTNVIFTWRYEPTTDFLRGFNAYK